MVRVPLSRRHIPNVLMWLHNKKGNYSMRSGYHIARVIIKEGCGLMESSGGGGEGKRFGLAKIMEMSFAE